MKKSYPGNKWILKLFIPVIVISIIFYFNTSCEEDIFAFNVDCSECYIEKPDSADIIVKISINAQNDSVPIKIYKNQVEDNEIEYIDTATSEEYYLYVPIDEFYSVTAEYNYNDSVTLVVVDGDKLKVKLVTDVCTDDCWVIRGGILDVRIKQ